MLIAWVTPNHAVVLAVGPHDRGPSDIYDLILTALKMELPTDERTKPPCCDELLDPPADQAIAESLADAITGLSRRIRRRA